MRCAASFGTLKVGGNDTYLFWDGIHPTKTVHEIVARQAAAALSSP